jgi:hypothetical protein
MTSQILFLALVLTFSSAFAQDAQEEALILNQELQFLENSVAPTKVTSLEGSNLAPKTKAPGETQSLERIYFGDETDSISSRVAAPDREAAPKKPVRVRGY